MKKRKLQDRDNDHCIGFQFKNDAKEVLQISLEYSDLLPLFKTLKAWKVASCEFEIQKDGDIDVTKLSSNFLKVVLFHLDKHKVKFIKTKHLPHSFSLDVNDFLNKTRRFRGQLTLQIYEYEDEYFAIAYQGTLENFTRFVKIGTCLPHEVIGGCHFFSTHQATLRCFDFQRVISSLKESIEPSERKIGIKFTPAGMECSVAAFSRTISYVDSSSLDNEDFAHNEVIYFLVDELSLLLPLLSYNPHLLLSLGSSSNHFLRIDVNLDKVDLESESIQHYEYLFDVLPKCLIQVIACYNYTPSIASAVLAALVS